MTDPDRAHAARIGIVTISDRASTGAYVDRGGPAVEVFLHRHLATPWTPVARMVADDRSSIESVLVELCDRERCDLVVTTGGTGPSPRDVTPEATLAIAHKELPGFGELMREVSLRVVPTAILSRQMAVVRGSTLVVNLPGQPNAIADCLGAVLPAIPYCLDLIGAASIDTAGGIVAFRPGSAVRSPDG